jgi:16S rRNA processing protein RimM
MPGWDDMVLVGRIARAHGHRGQVIVNPDTDFPEDRFRVGNVVHVRRGGHVQAMEITAARLQQGRPIIALSGVQTMTEAEEMAGAELRIPAGELAALPEGTFYRHDLIGCDVTTVGGERVGPVVGVEGTAAGSRLVIAGPRGEVLVPLASHICVVVDPAARRIVVDPPEGLLALNE